MNFTLAGMRERQARGPITKAGGRADGGNVALAFALLLPVLFGAAGAAFDFSRFSSARAELQEIADAAALAGAREYLLSKSGGAFAKLRADRVAASAIERSPGLAGAAAAVIADNRAQSVTVNLSFSYRPTVFVALVKTPISLGVEATADASGGANICVIGLNKVDGDVVLLDDNASLRGDDCAVYSNSVDPRGILVTGNAKLKSAFNCSSGGYGESDTRFSSVPITDCPPRVDPLADRPEPSVGACDWQDHLLKDYTGWISPGVYCGGLVIDGNSDVQLEPGLYIMRDGPFQAKDVSRLRGEDVSFFFAGADSRLLFEDSVRVSLSAPPDGVAAGVLFWRSRTAAGMDRFEVKSNFVDRLVGTIYIPNGEFFAHATAEIAENSEYTTIVADRIHLIGNTTLVLNSDYALATAPPPEGIANAGAIVKLRQ